MRNHTGVLHVQCPDMVQEREEKKQTLLLQYHHRPQLGCRQVPKKLNEINQKVPVATEVYTHRSHEK